MRGLGASVNFTENLSNSAFLFFFQFGLTTRIQQREDGGLTHHPSPEEIQLQTGSRQTDVRCADVAGGRGGTGREIPPAISLAIRWM